MSYFFSLISWIIRFVVSVDLYVVSADLYVVLTYLYVISLDLYVVLTYLCVALLYLYVDLSDMMTSWGQYVANFEQLEVIVMHKLCVSLICTNKYDSITIALWKIFTFLENLSPQVSY